MQLPPFQKFHSFPANANGGMDDEEQPIPNSQKLTASSTLHIEPENSRTPNLDSHFPPRLPPNVARDSPLSQIPPYSSSRDKRSEKEVRSIHHSPTATSDFDMKPQNSPPTLHSPSPQDNLPMQLEIPLFPNFHASLLMREEEWKREEPAIHHSTHSGNTSLS